MPTARAAKKFLAASSVMTMARCTPSTAFSVYPEDARILHSLHSHAQQERVYAHVTGLTYSTNLMLVGCYAHPAI